jgi:hypothetical protein
VQNGYVAVAVYEFYPTLGDSYPLQIDSWFDIDDACQIRAYDFAFRRFAWAMDEIIPYALPG